MLHPAEILPIAEAFVPSPAGYMLAANSQFRNLRRFLARTP